MCNGFCARCVTMLTEPATASPMPKNFCKEPASSPRHTAIIAVKTGMVGCMHVATSTPDSEMPMMYISWLKKRQTPRALTCSRSLRFGSTPAKNTTFRAVRSQEGQLADAGRALAVHLCIEHGCCYCSLHVPCTYERMPKPCCT